MSSAAAPHEVVVIGGGHNGLTAAAYLARAGRRVLVLEGRPEVGGAAASAALFTGLDARLSRFSYLVSLLPAQIVDELGLRLELRSRRVASYTPVGADGLLVERLEGPATAASFAALTGGTAEYAAWGQLGAELEELSKVVAPTLTEPLPRAADLQAKISPRLWDAVVERPLGELVCSRFSDDAVRGLVLTDALIGTFVSVHDASLRQNVCFLYHVIGNGTGGWKVPVGGMGAVTAELARVSVEAGVTISTGAPVVGVQPRRTGGGRVTLGDGSVVDAEVVLAGCAPATLARLLGEPTTDPRGSQLKINLLLTRLPRLRSGLEPETAFAGTLHLGQGYRRLEEAYAEAAAGRIPDPLPSEVYCHTLTDPTILAPELRDQGWHTLTLFGLHTPVDLFRSDPAGSRNRAAAAALRSLQAVLAEPLEDCLARDALGRACVETVTPVDLEDELGMPGGHIFHGDLSWPWLADDAAATSPAQRWGVATGHPGIMLCGSGAVRGGAVSGIGGQNAAMAVLEV